MSRLGIVALVLALSATPTLAQSPNERCGIAHVEKEWRANAELLACAQSGDPQAQAWLGMLYWSASESGADSWSDFALPGKLSVQGLEREGARLLEAAAVGGIAIAQNELGRAFKRGEFGRPIDYTQALRWLSAAAEQGDELAQYNLADMYLHGLGVTPSVSEAERLLRASSERGYRPARYSLAELLQDRGALDEARAIRNGVAASAEPCGPQDLLDGQQ